MISENSSPLPEASCIEAVSNPAIDHWSHIRCGSYTSEWVAQAVGIKAAPSNRILRGPIWFDLFRPVTPGDMRRLFKARGMETIEIRLAGLSDEERLHWIKNEIATKKRPPVILTRAKTLHWLAVGGYDDRKKIFYIYDSRVGADSFNINLPIGNVEMAYDEVLKTWQGRFGMNYVAIVVTNVQVRDLKKEKVEAILKAYARGDLVDKASFPKNEEKT